MGRMLKRVAAAHLLLQDGWQRKAQGPRAAGRWCGSSWWMPPVFGRRAAGGAGCWVWLWATCGAGDGAEGDFVGAPVPLAVALAAAAVGVEELFELLLLRTCVHGSKYSCCCGGGQAQTSSPALTCRAAGM